MPVKVIGERLGFIFGRPEPQKRRRRSWRAGIRYAVDNGAQVINMSIGFEGIIRPLPAVEEALPLRRRPGSVRDGLGNSYDGDGGNPVEPPGRVAAGSRACVGRRDRPRIWIGPLLEHRLARRARRARRRLPRRRRAGGISQIARRLGVTYRSRLGALPRAALRHLRLQLPARAHRSRRRTSPASLRCSRRASPPAAIEATLKRSRRISARPGVTTISASA